MKQSRKIFISQTDPTAAYTSITDALADLNVSDTDVSKTKDPDASITFVLDAGIYHEKLNINIPNLTIEGTTAEETIISYDDFAYYIMPDGIKRGTFRSYTMFVDAPGVTLRNLTIENASGASTVCGQGIALYADGDHFTCENCRLIGKQDTLFIAPLPEKEVEPGGFRGPKEHAPRLMTRQYYRDCYICGDVDFIFGSGKACFENCTIHSLMRDPSREIQGYVTAPSTPVGEDYGFIFSHCSFTSECPENSVYLGRPWREYAQAVFLNCTYENHIHTDGFHDWDKTHARELVNFAEYECRYSDATRSMNNRVSYAKHLDDAEAQKYILYAKKSMA